MGLTQRQASLFLLDPLSEAHTEMREPFPSPHPAVSFLSLSDLFSSSQTIANPCPAFLGLHRFLLLTRDYSFCSSGAEPGWRVGQWDPSSHKGQENVTRMPKPTHETQPDEEHCVSKNSSQRGAPWGCIRECLDGGAGPLSHLRHLLWESWGPPAAFQVRRSFPA